MCFLFLGTQGVFADQHSWDFGTEVSYIEYEEPDVMKEDGVMSGITSSYTYRSKIMLRGEGKYSWGEVDYKNSGTMNDVDDYMLEFRGLGGYDFTISDKTTLTPYIGFGYRYLNDDLAGTTSTGARGYERESNYYYSPIGLESITKLDNRWSLELAVEYDYFWKGIQKSHLSDTGLGFNDLENDQNKGHGVRGSAMLQTKTERLDFAVGPFIKYWNIKKSEEDTLTYSGVIFGNAWEPKNNSLEVGGRLSLMF